MLMLAYFFVPAAVGCYLMRKSGADFARTTVGTLWVFCIGGASFVATFAAFRHFQHADAPVPLMLTVSVALFAGTLWGVRRSTR